MILINVDIDTYIVNLLNLKDFYTFRLINSYFLSFCDNIMSKRLNESKKRAKRIIEVFNIFLDNRDGIVTKNFYPIKNTFIELYNIMTFIKLYKIQIFSNDNRQYQRIKIIYDKEEGEDDEYELEILFNDDTISGFYTTKDRIIEFVTHLFYNKII